jgi:hypothetical protein
MNRRTRNRRLLKLADLLKADARNKKGIKFDLRSWGRVASAAAPVSCGTTACAAGLAAISGVFKRQGLGYEYFGSGSIYITLHGACKEPDDSFDGSFISVREFFGLTNNEACWLFLSSYYHPGLSTFGAEGERNVEKRIRNFVADKESPPQGS